MTSTSSVLIGPREQSYISHEWIISQHRLNDSKRLENCRTKIFYVPSLKHVKYYLQFGYGDSKNRGKAILKFELQNVFPQQIYDANIFVSIKSANVSTEINAEFDYKNHGFSFVLCKWEELFDKEKNYLNSDGELIIELKGVLTGGERYFSGEEQLIPIRECLKLYEKRCDKKIHIDVGDQKIFIDHEIYEQLFRESYHRYPRLIVSDFSYKTVKQAVKFGYHPRLIYPATVEELMEVGQFFEKYASTDTLENYEDFLLYQIDELTVCHLAKCAIKYKNEILRIKCFELLIVCIQKSIPIIDFDQLPKSFALEVLDASVSHQIRA